MSRGACLQRFVARATRMSLAFRCAVPIHRLLHERCSQPNASSDLCGKFVETLGPKYAGSALVRCGKHWCYGEMEARLKGDSLINDSKTAIELFELAAHQGKATIYWEVIAVIIRTEELSESGLNQRRFAGAWQLGSCRQPRGHLLGEVDANSGLHGWTF
jgi:hypothetical protein